MRDSLYRDSTFTQVVDPAVTTSDADGASVDLQGYGECVFVAMLGETGDTLSGSVYIEFELEESDDNSAWTDVADADVTTSVTGTNTGTWAKVDAGSEDEASYACAYIGSARYVRPVVNLTGTHSNGTEIGVLAIRGRKSQTPANA